MEELSKSYQLKSFITPKTTDVIKFLENNGKYAVYQRENIHGIYRYLENIGAPTTLITSGQRSHHFGPSPDINNDTATLYPVIVYLRKR